MDKTVVLGISAVLVLVVAIGVVAARSGRSVPSQVNALQSHSVPEPSAELTTETPALPVAAHTETVALKMAPSNGTALTRPSSDRPEPFDETALMQRLRDLLGKDSLLAVRLAREGNQTSPNSQHAAERAWIVVKSLTDLGMFDEARAEARVMVERYRGTSWAEDVRRHVLVHPPGPPGP